MHRYNSDIVPRKVGSPALLRKVVILAERKTNPEFPSAKWEFKFVIDYCSVFLSITIFY